MSGLKDDGAVARARLRKAVTAAWTIAIALIAGCGGGDAASVDDAAGGRERALAAVPVGEAAGPTAAMPAASAVRPADAGNGSLLAAMTDAAREEPVRLAQQASFGATEALVQEIRDLGSARWIAAQMALDVSRYTSGRGDLIDRHGSDTFFCQQPAHAGPHCWRDWFSAEPLLWDFYRQAVANPDQLRQRVAFALQQIVVVSEVEVSGTYGLRHYHNLLRAHAFGNWRDLLRAVTLNPMMGEFLDHVNNDPLAPNENYARELLELFSVGPCRLRPDGRLVQGRCLPTYDNRLVREYAFALTGWTYPRGGRSYWGCWPQGTNCRYLEGEMVPAPALRNAGARTLLGGVQVPEGASAPQALERVLDSLMQHPNTAPFVARQLIQHLVASNPTPGYVARVAAAFERGEFRADGLVFGDGRRGSLAAAVAALLLDDEARIPPAYAARNGKLREPALMFTAVLRALNGRTDGAALGWWWGQELRQHVFRPPSVFNFYRPDYPLAGTALVGPQFGIHNASTALARLNFLTHLIDWGGMDPDPSVPGAVGTRVDLRPFLPLADDPPTLLRNLFLLATGREPRFAVRGPMLAAIRWWTPQTGGEAWREQRVRTAAYLVFAAPEFHVQR